MTELGSYADVVLDSYIDTYDNPEGRSRAELRKEFQCDMFGAFIYYRTENVPIHNQLGVSDDVALMFYDAFDTALEAGAIEYDNDIMNAEFSENDVVEPVLALTRKEIEAIQSVERKSINDFTSEDIRKTKTFARRYFRELGPKSPFFRAWFGDWRENDQTRITVVTAQGDTRSNHVNKDTGWVIRNSGKVHAETKAHQSSKNRNAIPYLPYIDGIIENAILLDTKSIGKKKSENSLMMHYLYAVADIGNGPEVLKLHVEEMYNPAEKRADRRTYALHNIEKAFVASVRVQGNSSSSVTSTTNALTTVADLFARVKQMDADFAPREVSKLVNHDGTPKIFYHGAKNGGGFTVFKDWQYFTENKEYADRYAKRDDPEALYAVYLKMEKPFDTRLPECARIFEQMRQEYGLSDLQENGLPDWTDGYDIADFIEENELDYDGIILNEGGDLVNGEPVSRGLSYVARSSNQIKSAENNEGT